MARRHDPDRFLCALFAPPAARETLFVLTAFNHELARAREAASNPMLALIRLQWWREVVEGTPKRHEVATPLSEAIAAGALDRDDLLAMIAAREVEADDAIPDLDAWRDYLRGTAGRLALAAGRVLGAADPALEDLGAAYGAAGVLRAAPVDLAAGRCRVPADHLERDRLTQAGAASLARAALGWLGGRVARPARPAALPAVLARRDLRRLARGLAPGPRGLGDRLAVIWSGLTGHL